MATPTKSRLYRTERTLTRTLRVAYPSGRGRMVLRTEKDWEQSLEPVAVSDDGHVSTFELEADQPLLYFKLCLVESGATHWAVGANTLLLMKVDQTGDVLRAMSAVEDFLILGVYSGDRMTEYTKPGYVQYARSLVEEVVPEVERRGVRAEPHRRYRSVWGSSLGGVVSFYTAWQHPDVFGSAVCMSSTFSHRDDLIDRVFAEPFRDVGFYLDSGWPGDNYEVTVGMAMALISRGWEYGRNLLHLCFPLAGHSESAWGTRLHLPLQFLNGAVARAYRVKRPVLGDHPFERA